MRFSRNTFASIHPDLHSGLDAVLLGVRVFYRSRFSPNPLDLSLFSVSICFLVFVFFLEEASAQLRYFSINDRISIVSSSLSRGIEFLSSLKLFCLVFLFFWRRGGRVLTILCPRGEYFEHAEKAGFDKGYDWLILSFDVRVRPETTIKIQGGIESLGASFDASSKSRPLDSFQRAR